jgi:hypothetical protein
MKRIFQSVVLLISLAGCEGEAQKAERIERARLLPVAQAAIDGVKASLVDPNSAMFSDVTILNGSILCGKVNAKNRMGGYNGNKSFVYIGSRALVEQDVQAPSIGYGGSFDYDGYARYNESLNVELQIRKLCSDSTNSRPVQIEGQTAKSVGENTTAQQAQDAERAADAAVAAAAEALAKK